jgi:hypothetical protein
VLVAAFGEVEGLQAARIHVAMANPAMILRFGIIISDMIITGVIG